MRNSLSAATSILCLVFSPEAMAHDVEISVTIAGGAILGEATYFGGSPVKNVTISVSDSEGNPLGTSRTDDRGFFVYRPDSQVDHVFTVETSDGHRDSVTMLAADLPSVERDDVNGSPSDAVDEARLRAIVREEVSEQLAPLALQIEKNSSAVRVHDVIAGIGYIAGVFGVVALIQARSRRNRPE